MPSTSNKLEWCVVRLGEDMNWWVAEVSDDIHWDVDGLSIVDPKQMAHLIELVEPLRDYNFDQDLLESAFIAFRIDKDLGKGHIRLVRSKESFVDAEDPLFGLPDLVDEENGPYAEFLNHITKARVAMLNDLIDFEQKLTIDEVEESIREEQNNRFIEGRAVHVFEEVTSILDYVPAGWELDEESEEDEGGEEEETTDMEDFPEIDNEEEVEKIGENESLKWDEDEEVEADEGGEEELPEAEEGEDEEEELEAKEEDDRN